MYLWTSQTPFITLHGSYHDVIKQQVNITKATVATKAYAMGEIT